MVTISTGRLFFAWSIGFLTASLVTVVLLVAPARLQAAGVSTQQVTPVGQPTLQSLEDQFSVLNLTVGKLRAQVDSLQTQLNASNRQIDALSKQVAALPKTSEDAELRVAFCNHNHLIEYNNQDQGTFGLIDNTTAKRPAICSI